MPTPIPSQHIVDLLTHLPVDARDPLVPNDARRLLRDLEELRDDGLTDPMCVAVLRGRNGRYRPALLLALERSLGLTLREPVIHEVEISQLRIGLLLAQSIRSASGRLLLARGLELDANLCQVLRASNPKDVRGPLRVVIPRETV